MVRTFWLWLVVIASACASARSTGSFVERTPPPAMRELARDASRQLARLYPPAHTQLSFAHSTDDAFGRPLLTELRGVGFAVVEARARGTQLVMSYAVDEVGTLCRVVLRLTSARRRITLARAYSRRGMAVLGAGAWTQQEVR